MDSVTTAFELMEVELDSEVDSLNARGAECFRNSDYSQAERLIAEGKSLLDFCARVRELSDEWKDKFSASFPEEVVPNNVVEARKTILGASKSAKTLLTVKFEDGTVVYEPKALETFALAIQKIGFDRVERLGLVVNREPLVSRSPSKRYADFQVGNTFIKTHSSTSQKKRTLEEIAARLGESLIVRIVEA
ncbi:hypothetical protein [Vannielia litorea]|uniref:Uncharacterized protein n=1 Tax=Vannielia litorea TaxID=1217970 RepID=A0A1N6DY56_9RHOB|nr:hypothetical protein [Vannielia litorea]SIN75644.1 hypothetical protein SAMN05444002_0129 [Vannielia litorea]